ISRSSRCRGALGYGAKGAWSKGCFFFQAEDGIRDRTVTGVQTYALPISKSLLGCPPEQSRSGPVPHLRSHELGGGSTESGRRGSRAAACSGFVAYEEDVGAWW